MEIHTFFLYLLVILLTARVFAEVASRLSTPPVIGEILALVMKWFYGRYGHTMSAVSEHSLDGIS
jgi:Kef-type K+ transport system membrane component KefB